LLFVFFSPRISLETTTNPVFQNNLIRTLLRPDFFATFQHGFISSTKKEAASS
jgi:predicted lactoylglutathione lyase